MDGATPCCSQNGDRAAVVETQQVAICSLSLSYHRCFLKHGSDSILDPSLTNWGSSFELTQPSKRKKEKKENKIKKGRTKNNERPELYSYFRSLINIALRGKRGINSFWNKEKTKETFDLSIGDSSFQKILDFSWTILENSRSCLKTGLVPRWSSTKRIRSRFRVALADRFDPLEARYSRDIGEKERGRLWAEPMPSERKGYPCFRKSGTVGAAATTIRRVHGPFYVSTSWVERSRTNLRDKPLPRRMRRWWWRFPRSRLAFLY